MSSLDELVAGAREDARRRQEEVPLETLRARLVGRDGARPFNEALVRPGLSLIAEFKRRSPSAGDLHPDAGVAETVRGYERAGAAALSILTEERQFGGSLHDLRAAREAADLPILRKDFIVDPYQLFESAANGADAVLLIVTALDDHELAELYAQARALDLDCLDELERIGVDAVLIGEALMRAEEPELLIRELTRDEEATREHYLERASEE